MFDVIVTAQVLQQHKLRTSFQHVNIPGQAIAVWHASKTYRLAYPEAYAVKRQFISQIAVWSRQVQTLLRHFSPWLCPLLRLARRPVDVAVAVTFATCQS